MGFLAFTMSAYALVETARYGFRRMDSLTLFIAAVALVLVGLMLATTYFRVDMVLFEWYGAGADYRECLADVHEAARNMPPEGRHAAVQDMLAAERLACEEALEAESPQYAWRLD